MATQVQFRRGTTTEHNSFTGAAAEVTVDTTLDTLRVHDGSTAGGVRIAKFSEIDNRFIKFLDYLEPFGPGNPKPIFSTKKINQFSDVQLIGKDRDTLKFIAHGQTGSFDVIGFRMVENYEKLLSNKNIDIAYSIDKNYWNGKTSIQLVLKDLIYSDE